MRPFEPSPPPDPGEPGAVERWMLAEAERLAAWTAEMDRDIARMERVGSFLGIMVPTLLLALALYSMSRREWVLAAINGGNGVFLLWFKHRIDRRTARRIAERQALRVRHVPTVAYVRRDTYHVEHVGTGVGREKGP